MLPLVVPVTERPQVERVTYNALPAMLTGSEYQMLKIVNRADDHRL